jgi:hypothetical protein
MNVSSRTSFKMGGLWNRVTNETPAIGIAMREGEMN